MINRRLTAPEAAERLGVKPATLYSYVSRGVLSRERGPEGSTFDPHEIARLARTARRPRGQDLPGRRRGARVEASDVDPLFMTELTLIQNGNLYYRGSDAVALSRCRSFEEVSGWLWSGEWPDPAERWVPPSRISSAAAASVRLAGKDRPLSEVILLAVLASSLADDLRHDLNPSGVPVTARALIASVVDSLAVLQGAGDEEGGDPRSISERLWVRLSPLALTVPRREVLEAALVLNADHELAPSTLTARIAASFRADPYAVVMTALGPTGGEWPSGSSGAPSEVERLLEESRRIGPEAAIGSWLRRVGTVPYGFGMPLYPGGDPRGTEILARIEERSDWAERFEVVRAVLAVARHREFPPPNVDMGLGALSFCAQMVPGSAQTIATVAKVAGWLAHAMEEYSQPTRFRSRADYVGSRPAPSPSGSSGAPDSPGAGPSSLAPA